MRRPKSYWPRVARARRRNAPTNPHYAAIADRAGLRCEYCRVTEALFPEVFHVEHIVPEHAGGLTFLANLALACSACNDAKRTTLGLLHRGSGLPVWLFNPRVDAWDGHFALDPVTGRIEGKTNKGRVTAECLGMNLDKPLQARCMWIALCVYP